MFYPIQNSLTNIIYLYLDVSVIEDDTAGGTLQILIAGEHLNNWNCKRLQ